MSFELLAAGEWCRVLFGLLATITRQQACREGEVFSQIYSSLLDSDAAVAPAGSLVTSPQMTERERCKGRFKGVPELPDGPGIALFSGPSSGSR
jgi:hypothetical protein